MNISENLTQWLANGERGASSETIVHYVTGIKTNDWHDHPLDPSDLGRCVKLLEACPELVDGFKDKMPKVSPVWARLVEHWDELVAMLDDEVPGWRHGKHGLASKTYNMMKKLQGRA